MSASPNPNSAGPTKPDASSQDFLGTALAVLLVGVSIGWILDLAGYAGVALFDEQPLALALGLALALTAIVLTGHAGRFGRHVGIAAACVLLALLVMVAWRYPNLVVTAMMRPAWLIATSVAVIGGLLLLVWRTTGLPITLIVIALMTTAVFGSVFHMPETGADRLAIYLLVDPNSVLGLPLRVAVDIVIPFVLFGELLRKSGGSEYLTRLSLAAFGRYRGGSAKAACAASAAFGSISGNAVSNVVGTGIVTIPLMKRTGLTSEEAAAVEAAASTGGQLLPPVMGAAAFVMADYLQVPYTDVAIAAALPAALYFTAIFLQIDRAAARKGLKGMAVQERIGLRGTFLSGAHLLIPFFVLFYVLFMDQTRPGLAALAAAGSLILVSILRPFEGNRLTPSRIGRAVIDAGLTVAPLILVTAAAGAIVGLISLTGLGFSIASDVVAFSGGNAILLLMLVAVIAIVFGMGMPTVAVYVVLATVLAPALTDVGLGRMQAHLFILYFGMMSMLTPPVALASIAAAKIGNADMWRTSFAAVKLAWVAYIIPFLFVFSPELLLGGTPFGAFLATVTAFLGIAAISFAAAGFARGPLSETGRLVYVVLGLALLFPPTLGLWSMIANAAGAIVFLALFVWPQAARADSGLLSPLSPRSKN